MFNLLADPGERLDPAVRAEVDLLAPSTIDDGDITESMLADDAVSQRTIAPGAVGHVEIETGGVEEENLAPNAVTTDKIIDAAVTAAKAGEGVVTAYDHVGNPIESKDVYLSAAQYNMIDTPDPNTTYNIVG